jgi:hypothetical protein
LPTTLNIPLPSLIGLHLYMPRYFLLSCPLGAKPLTRATLQLFPTFLLPK